MRVSNKRGVALVSVLFFVLVVGMFSRVVLANGPGMARMANQALTETLAQRAAEAGAAYARLQLREDGDWKGDANATTINRPDLIVVEDNGDVFGWLKGGTNQVTMFRIRFNYHDGAGPGSDDLPNPANFALIPAVSVNNVNSSLGSTTVPDVDLSDAVLTVPDPTVGTRAVPQGKAMVRVEGWAGSSLSTLTSPLDNPVPGEELMKRTLNVVYTASIDPNIPDSAFSAGGGIFSEVTNGMDVAIIGTGTAKLRSKLGVGVTQSDGTTPNNLTMDGEVSHSASETINAVHSITNEPVEEIGDGQDFHNIPWSDVPTASADETVDVQLPGGIYVVDAAGQYHYFDMDIAEYEALTPDPSTFLRPGGLPLSNNFSEIRSGGAFANNMSVTGLSNDPATRKLTINQSVNVYDSPGTGAAGPVNDILITNLSGRPLEVGETPATSPYLFTGPDPTLTPMGNLEINDSTLSAQGDIALMVNVRGSNGAIATESDAIVSAPAVSLITTDQRLSVYAKQDLKISTYLEVMAGPYNPEIIGYGTLNLEGLVYAWGDATILAGTPGTADPLNAFGTKTYGAIDIKGALVAYGGDPEAFDGSATTGPGTAVDALGDPMGRIKLYGDTANIRYDRTKLVADPSLAPPGPGIPVERVSYGFEN